MIHKTEKEKSALKIAKKVLNANKREYPVLHKNLRDEVIKVVVNSPTPDWGGLQVKITNNGV